MRLAHVPSIDTKFRRKRIYAELMSASRQQFKLQAVKLVAYLECRHTELKFDVLPLSCLAVGVSQGSNKARDIFTVSRR